MTPFFTIITPTLQRESLIKTCESIDSQTFTDYQHIIQIDVDAPDNGVLSRISNKNRTFGMCLTNHKNGGNTCRRLAWLGATGEWIIYCDDDNYFTDSRVLEDIAAVLPQDKLWALFPIDRLGLRFYTDPPRSCHTDTLNMVLRREIAQWPDTDAYGSDGVMVDDLMARGIPYAAFPDFRPIAVIPKISFCQ